MNIAQTQAVCMDTLGNKLCWQFPHLLEVLR